MVINQLYVSEAIYKKMLMSPRGGWCHEKNALLYWALKEIGFEEVKMLNALAWVQGLRLREAFGHLAVMVTIDGKKYLADVAWGGSNVKRSKFNP